VLTLKPAVYIQRYYCFTDSWRSKFANSSSRCRVRRYYCFTDSWRSYMYL